MMIASGLRVAGLQIQSVDSSSSTCLLASETPEDRQDEWNVGVASVVRWGQAPLRDH